MIPFIKYMVVVNAAMAALLAAFYGAVEACNRLGISPWWAAVPYIAGFAFYVKFELKQAYDPRSERS
ncbi:hypothetical protein [Acidicapsa acidisoli]|uniref:hypothetical protein n=1 Tax=Acidicapsa acidisoli TaxID=1615681 RepID=UPI0021DF9E09|nr:hypothetical protein [Acidicapsa acidisoli]